MGKYLQYCWPCSCGAVRGKLSAQLHAEASASQIALASVSCPPFRPGKNQVPIRPAPILIIHDVTSTLPFFCF